MFWVRPIVLLTTFCAMNFLISSPLFAQKKDSITLALRTYLPSDNFYLLNTATDKRQNYFGTGHCSDFINTASGFQPTGHGDEDGIIFKVDSALKTVIWASYIGGDGGDAGGAIALDSSGNVYVSGYTFSRNFPSTNISDTAYLNNPRPKYFVCKVSPDGRRLIYCRIIGVGIVDDREAHSASRGAHMSVSAGGEVYVLGSVTSGQPYRITPNAWRTTPNGLVDMVFTKLDQSGEIVYSTYVGGRGNDFASGILFDNDRIFGIGTTNSANIINAVGRTPNSQDCIAFVFRDGLVPSYVRSHIFGDTSLNDTSTSLCYDARLNRVLITGAFKVNRNSRLGDGFCIALDSTLNQYTFLTSTGANTLGMSAKPRPANNDIVIVGIAYKNIFDPFVMIVPPSGSPIKNYLIETPKFDDYQVSTVHVFEEGCRLKFAYGLTTHSDNWRFPDQISQPPAQVIAREKPPLSDDVGLLSIFKLQPLPSVKIEYANCERRATIRIKFDCKPASFTVFYGDGSPPVLGDTLLSHTYSADGEYPLAIEYGYGSDDVFRYLVPLGVHFEFGARRVNAGADTTICAESPLARLHGRNNVSYSWSPGHMLDDSTIANPRAELTRDTDFILRGIDSLGCISFDTVSITVKEVKAVVSRDTTICEGSSVLLMASGGERVQWYPRTGLSLPDFETTLAEPTKTTTYRVVVGVGVCTDTAKVTVTVHKKPTIRLSHDIAICERRELTIAPIYTVDSSESLADLKYSWSVLVGDLSSILSSKTAGRITINPGGKTIYRIEVVDKFGCVAIDTVQVRFTDFITVTVTKDTNVCYGELLQLEANGATSYSWSPPDNLSDPNSAVPICHAVQPTYYTVIGVSGKCRDTATIAVGVRAKLSLTARGDTAVCEGELIRLRVVNPQADVVYTWSPPEDFTYPESTEQLITAKRDFYVVTMTDRFNCTVSDTLRIDQSGLKVRTDNDTTVCKGSRVEFRIHSPIDFSSRIRWRASNGSWDSTRQVFSFVADSTEKVVLEITRRGCVGYDTVNVHVEETPRATLSAPSTVCLGETFSLSASIDGAMDNFLWIRNGVPDGMVQSATSLITAVGPISESTTFYFRTGLRNCSRIDSIVVNVYPAIELVFPQNDSICNGSQSVADMSSQSVKSIDCTPTETVERLTPTILRVRPTSTTTYTITAIDQNGCTRSHEWTVKVAETNRLYLTATSVDLGLGKRGALLIHASTDRPLDTPINYSLTANSKYFVPSESIVSTVVGDLRTCRRSTRALALTSIPQIVDSIPATLYLTALRDRIFQLQGQPTDSLVCLLESVTTFRLDDDGCFSSGRPIQHLEPLSILLSPNPSIHKSNIYITTDYRGEGRVAIHSSDGTLVYSGLIELAQLVSEMSIPTISLSAGLYSATVHAGAESARLLFVKE